MIDLKDVVRIDPIEATFRERTTGSVDLGLDLLTANDEIDWTFNIAAANQTRNYLTEVSLSSLVRRHNDETAQQRNRFEIATATLHCCWKPRPTSPRTTGACASTWRAACGTTSPVIII